MEIERKPPSERTPEEWYFLGLFASEAKCLGAYGVMFPEQERGTAFNEAVAVCTGGDGSPPCRIINECREYAIVADEPEGVWGGIGKRERKRERRRRGLIRPRES